MTSEWHLLTILARTAAALGFLVSATVLWRGRKIGGPVIHAFALAWGAATLSMVWYIAASMCYAAGSRACYRIGWEWGWVVWIPAAVAAWRLVWVLRRVLWAKAK